jgi:cell division protein FtsN
MTKFGGRQQQRGGTFVGIIIGIIIGVAICAAIAFVVTKSSLPFMNKVAKQDKAPELTAGQAADPNKALYGSNAAAKEAEKDFNAPSAVPGAAPSPVPPNGVTATPSAPAGPTSAAPAASAAAKAASASSAASATLAAKPDNADDKFTYFLQAGAFRDQADAENSKAKLALSGFEASITDKGTDANGLYRVRIGPFNQLEAMNRVRGKLSDNGIDVAVVRVAK